MPWSRRARRDFDERKEYRKERGEEDRYKKRDGDSREERRVDSDSDTNYDDNRSPREQEEAARQDRREERGYSEDVWGDEDFENFLMQVRNASPDDNVDEALTRIRERYDYYERELDKYDADYDNLMAEVERLRRDNYRYMMRDSAREEGREADRMQNEDIKQDGERMDFDDLWRTREG